jgi:hypothetical protein
VFRFVLWARCNNAFSVTFVWRLCHLPWTSASSFITCAPFPRFFASHFNTQLGCCRSKLKAAATCRLLSQWSGNVQRRKAEHNTTVCEVSFDEFGHVTLSRHRQRGQQQFRSVSVKSAALEFLEWIFFAKSSPKSFVPRALICLLRPALHLLSDPFIAPPNPPKPP